MPLLCFFGFHSWTPWYPWWRDAPRIVFASAEYRNDPTEFSDCAYCPKRQMRNPYFVPTPTETRGDTNTSAEMKNG